MRRPLSVILAAVALAAFIGPPCPAQDAPPPAKLGAVPGMGLGGSILSYRNDELIFADLIKSAAGFNGYRGTAPTPPYRADGWPTRVDSGTGSTTLVLGLDANLPAGDYTVRGKGKGMIWLSGNFAAKDAAGKWVPKDLLTITFDGTGKATPEIINLAQAGVNWAGQLGLQVAQSDAADPIRDVEIKLPGHADKQFYGLFLEDLRPFAVIRGMDWLNTNSGTIREWDRRPKPKLSYYQEGRVPEEVLVDLCNALKKDLWLNIPVLASLDYVEKLAAMVDGRLDPSLRVYVEYGNEIWNASFPHWAVLKAEQADPLRNPLKIAGEWQFRAWLDGQRTNLFKSKLKPGRRCTIVLARQLGYIETIRNAIATYKQYGFKFDAISCASYFWPLAKGANVTNPLAVNITDLATRWGSVDKPLADARAALKIAAEADRPDLQAKVDQLAKDQAAARDAALASLFAAIPPILDEFNRGGIKDGKPVEGYMVTWKKIADAEKVPLMFYEGGQGMENWTIEANTPFLTAAQRDPRMGEAYRLMASSLPSGTGPLCFYWSVGGWGKWGYWGHKERTGASPAQSPKYAAIMDLIPPVPTAYTLAGPAQGTAGKPSGPFRLQLDLAPPPASPVKVTVDYSGALGGKAEFTLTSAEPVEFSPTPAASGTLTLTASNDSRLADPAPLAQAVADPPLEPVRGAALGLLGALGLGGYLEVGTDGVYTAIVPDSATVGYRRFKLMPVPAVPAATPAPR